MESSLKARVSKLFGAQDMTVGTPWKCILKFSVPLLIGNIAQQLYSTVDSIIVGKYVGDNALAAVGASMPILNLLLVLFMGVSTGAGILVSQFFGAKDRKNLSITCGNCITLTFIASIIVTVLGILTTRPMLSMLSTPPEIFQMCEDYMIILFIGMIGMGYYNIISGVLRGLGDSVTPLLYLLVACALNIVLDIWFVASFGMGVAGVAWATIIAQGISGALCLLRLWKLRANVDINRHTLKLDRRISVQIGRLGMPSGITQAIFSMAMIVVQSLTNSFGAFIITCNTMVMRVDGFAMMPNFTFGMAMTTYAGQNVGAGDIDRVHKGTISGFKIGLVCSTLLTICILVFGRLMLSLFTNTPEVIDQGMHQMQIIAVGYIAVSITQVLSGVMRGAGDTMTPMWIALITTVIVRVPIAYLMAWTTRSNALPNGSADSLYYSLLISWLLGALLTGIMYKKGKWRSKAVVLR